MKLVNYLGLLVLLISSQSLQSCQKGKSADTPCPNEPNAALNTNRVEEVTLTSAPILRSGQSSTNQPTGYKFAGKKGESIEFNIKNKDICTWLYNPDNQIVRDNTLPKDGNYILEIAQVNGAGTFTIEMSLKGASVSGQPSGSPNPSPTPSIGNETPIETPNRDSIGRRNIDRFKRESKNNSILSTDRKFSCDDAPSDFTCNNAINLIMRWFDAKQSLFGPEYSKSKLAEISLDEAYKKYLKKNSPDKLSKRGIYHKYNQTIDEIKNIQKVSKNLVIVRAIITEYRTIYNRQNIIRENQRTRKKGSFCYEFQKVDDSWKISRMPDLIPGCKKNK